MRRLKYYISELLEQCKVYLRTITSRWTGPKIILPAASLETGWPAEALELHNKVYAWEPKLLGKDNPHVVWTLLDIARCNHHLGKTAEVTIKQRELLDRKLRVLGAVHPDTYWAINILTLLCEINENTAEARKLRERAQRAQALSLGDSHPHTVWSADAVTRLKLM